MKSKYIPMPGSRISTETAQIVGKELVRISRQHGCVKPDVVVDEATPEDSPLHPFFTWNDEEAAHQHRLAEARNIIRSVRVVITGILPQEQPVIRAFLNVAASDTETKFDGSAYLPMYVVQRRPEYQQQLIDAAKRELVEWKNRYQDLSDFFSGTFAAIEEETADQKP